MNLTYKSLALLLSAAILLAAAQVYIPAVHTAPGCNYWAAPPPRGDDANPGSPEAPWASIAHAARTVPDESCTVWVQDGVYNGKNSIKRRFDSQTTFRAVNPYRAVLQHSGSPLVVRGGRNMLFEGFEFRQTGPGSDKMLVQVYRDGDVLSEYITFRNNIFHDSFNDDLLKIYTGSSFVTVENNVFYNQGPAEQHMDVNSVHHVLIQGNIFFNDYAGSGRTSPGDGKHFIVIKDSNGPEDGLVGSRLVTVRNNVFLSWQGGIEAFIKTGNDGKAYYEARDILIENNLMLGDGLDQVDSPFSVRGAKDVTFRNNTITGDLPSNAYAVRIALAEDNPINQNIYFYNNIWSDPTGTMGADGLGGDNEFSNGDPAASQNVILDNNLYWNGDQEIPSGDLIDPVADDSRHLIGDPLLETNHQGIVLPRWNGSGFISGQGTIRQEFERLVAAYGSIPAASIAIGQADPALAPEQDILGRQRDSAPDMGAYEHGLSLRGFGDLTGMWLFWSAVPQGRAVTMNINLQGADHNRTVLDLPIEERSYRFDDLSPYGLYAVTLAALDDEGQIVAQSEQIFLRLSGNNH